MEILVPEETGIWVVDVQEKLFPLIDRSHQVLERICFCLEAARVLGLPFLVTEQYPRGLGNTLPSVLERLPGDTAVHAKTHFSGYADPEIRKAADALGVKNWLLVGVEAHICVLQTAKDLLRAGKNVVVLNDAVSSRSMFDFSTAMGELRDCGVRLSSTETVIYEMVRDADTPLFKELLPLIKTASIHV